LTQCDAAQTVDTLRGLLDLEVTVDPVTGKPTLAVTGTGQEAWLTAVVDAAKAAADDETVVATLKQIQLDDTEGGTGIHLGKDAFELVAKLLAANLAAPNFDPAFTRQLLDDVIVSRLPDDNAKAKV